MMDFVSWDDEIPNIWNNKKWLKPPTSNEWVNLTPTLDHGALFLSALGNNMAMSQVLGYKVGPLSQLNVWSDTYTLW